MGNNVLRSLCHAGLSLLAGHNLLRIAHVYGIVLDKTILALTESCPLRRNLRYLNILWSTIKDCQISAFHRDIAICSLSIIDPENNVILTGQFKSIILNNLLVIKVHCNLGTLAGDAQLVPILVLIYLILSCRGRCQS